MVTVNIREIYAKFKDLYIALSIGRFKEALELSRWLYNVFQVFKDLDISADLPPCEYLQQRRDPE